MTDRLKEIRERFTGINVTRRARADEIFFLLDRIEELEAKIRTLESELRSERRQLKATRKMRSALSVRCEHYRDFLEEIMSGKFVDFSDIEERARAVLQCQAEPHVKEVEKSRKEWG